MILTISINKFWKDVWCPNRKQPSLFNVLVFFHHTQVNCEIFLFRMSEQSWICMASCIQLSVYYKHSYSISTLMYRLILVPFFYRIRILLHKLEPNGNLEKWNRNQKEQIVPFFFVISVTCDSPTGSQYI